MTSGGEMYLGMVIVAFVAFAVVLLHVNHKTEG